MNECRIGEADSIQSSATVRRIAARLLFIAALVASGCSILPHPPPQPEVLSLPTAGGSFIQERPLRIM